MAKYLDETGLQTLWKKIKGTFVPLSGGSLNDGATVTLKSGSDTAQYSNAGVVTDGYTISYPTLTKDEVFATENYVGEKVAEVIAGSVDLTPYAKKEFLSTINGAPIYNESGATDITIDLTLFKVVTTLPTSDIDMNKIYLVKSAETETGNVYTEYIYANNAWEKLGEYKSEVDLTPYAKTTDVESALAKKVDKETGKGLSTNDFTDALKTKLDGIAAGANNYVHPASAAGAKANGLYKITTDVNGHVTAATAVAKADITALGIPAQDTTYSAATTSAAGLMSAADKTKLDGLAAGATADSAIPVATIEALS